MYKTKEQKDALHRQLVKWLGDCENSSAETDWQDRAEEDYKFYAGDQDTAEVKATLEAQGRPIPVFNEIKPKVDMLVGMGAQLEGAVTILPRTAEDGPLTELMIGAHEYFRDKMRSNRKETSCFEHAIKCGQSWMHFWVDDQDKESVLKCERVPARFCHCDPDAINTDKSDARFFFRDKWFTAEDIEAAWPKFKFPRDEAGNVVGITEFTQAEQQKVFYPTFFNEAKEKYRIVEAWWRRYETKYHFLNPITKEHEELFEEEFKDFKKALKDGIQLSDDPEDVLQTPDLPAVEVLTKTVWFAIFCGNEVLETQRSSYEHGMIPYVYLEAYHNEDLNNSLSVIDSMKDPQRALNTTRRQLIHLLNTLPKGILVHEVGAILNIEDYEDNSSKPGFHLELSKGGLSKYKFEQQPQISQIYNQLDALFQQSMKDSSGIQDALLGIQTSTREPGITAQMRSDASASVLYTLFDNYKEFKYNCAIITVSNIQQFVTDQQMIRIQGQDGYQLMEINSQMNPQLEGWNDLSAGKFDLIVDEDMITKRMKQAVAQMLTEFATNNPGSIPVDLLAEYSNMPYSTRVKMSEYRTMQEQTAQAAQENEALMEGEKLKIEWYKAETDRLKVENDSKQVNKNPGRDE